MQGQVCRPADRKSLERQNSFNLNGITYKCVQYTHMCVVLTLFDTSAEAEKRGFRQIGRGCNSEANVFKAQPLDLALLRMVVSFSHKLFVPTCSPDWSRSESRIWDRSWISS